MTGHERIAARNIKGAFNWIIGGWYNSYQDGELDNIPKVSAEEMKEELYQESLTNLYDCDTVSYDEAPKEMRFAGEKFCRKYIDKLWDSDGDIKELQDAGVFLPKAQKQAKSSKKTSAEEKPNYKDFSLEELKEMAKTMGADCKECSNERIYRMRLTMAIKSKRGE